MMKERVPDEIITQADQVVNSDSRSPAFLPSANLDESMPHFIIRRANVAIFKVQSSEIDGRLILSDGS